MWEAVWYWGQICGVGAVVGLIIMVLIVGFAIRYCVIMGEDDGA